MQQFQRFLRHESATGVLLIVATVFALLCANTGLAEVYSLLLTTSFEIHLGDWKLAKPLLLWVNDGLMAVFFLLVGLELKREMLAGELSRPRKIMLPVFAAVGGMVVPALIYLLINRHDPLALKGWAIPSATDIAFSLGVLSMLGNRVPVALKVFLTSVAVIDDLGAIVIIALFYTAKLAMGALLFAVVVLGGLLALNRCGVRRPAPYVLLGLLLWTAVLKSGVHATLAGVVMAMFIPMHPDQPEESVLHRMEHGLHPWVAFGILPLFAFANAGVSLSGLSLASLLQPMSLGIVLGLFLGKQLGVTLFSYLATRLRLAELPEGVSWSQIYGVAILCGIGFTMSLFISSLAFENTGENAYSVGDRLGILTGSLLSGVTGWLFLRWRLQRGPSRTSAPG